ncbi:MAG: YcnI family protein [Pseudomonadota bacterium]
MKKHSIKTQTVIFAAGLLCAAALPASAHVVLEYQVANAGSSYKASFKVGHGCGTSPTRQIIVTIPGGVQGAKPMPKAGWTVETSREKLAQPVMDHGRTVTEDVSRITWTAKAPADYLQNDWYDEFVLQAKLPDKAGTIYWPVSQVCETGRIDWTDIPKAGQKMSDVKSPAAALELMPTGGSSGGEHKH